MSIVQEFKIFENLPGEIKNNIKWFHVFDSVFRISAGEYIERKPFAFIGTRDDLVFSCGSNETTEVSFLPQVFLARDKDQPVNEWTKMDELCGHNIDEIHQGMTHMLAKNQQGQVFAWGNNAMGQMGQGHRISDTPYKPMKIDYFDDKDVQVICSGDFHSLALSSRGVVYTWGTNHAGQCGCPKNEEVDRPYDIVSTPIQPFADDKIKFKFIHAYYNCSFAINFDGLVYVWGTNSKNQLGLSDKFEYFEPQIITLNRITKISSSFDLTFFITEQGDVYRCGMTSVTDKEAMEEIVKEKKGEEEMWKITQMVFVELEQVNCEQRLFDAYHNKFVSEHGVFMYRENKNQFEKSKYINLVDHYLHEFGTTPKTIHIDDDGFLVTKEYSYSSSKINTNFKNIYVNSELLKKFTIIKQIGYGGFGKVLLVRENESQRQYAMKKIWIECKDKDDKNELFREIRNLCQLNSDFVVEIVNAWIDTKKVFLYILMDYCDRSLAKIIDIKPQLFERDFSQPMNGLEFFVTLNLLRDITECLYYMHEPMKRYLDTMISDQHEGEFDYNKYIEDPRSSDRISLIHRDIKPDNYLINSHGYNGKFIKLCDFGMSKISDGYESSWGGTPRYMAPEVNQGKYNHKADIYSLGIIAQELFEIKNMNEIEKYTGTSLEINFSLLLDTIQRMVQVNFEQRPSCKELLQLHQVIKPNCVQIFDETSKVLLQKLAHQDKLYFEYTKSKLSGMNIICDLCKNVLFNLHEKQLKMGFHCQVCPDFDLCKQCNDKDDHSSNHTMTLVNYQDYRDILLWEGEESPLISEAPSPRLCHVIRIPGIRSGFSIYTNKYTNVHHILLAEPDLPAYSAGLRVGDRIIEVDMVNVDRDNASAIFKRLDEPEEFKILVVDVETEQWYKKRKLVPKSWHSNVVHLKTEIDQVKDKQKKMDQP